MRTTLDIDGDLLDAVREMARRENVTAGRVVSRLLRQVSTQGAVEKGGADVREPDACYGFRPFASRGGVVTDALVDRLREEEVI